MNYQEARIKAKTEGVKIRHEYFSSEEFFEWKNGHLVCEGGYNMSSWYTGKDWQWEGWSVVE